MDNKLDNTIDNKKYIEINTIIEDILNKATKKEIAKKTIHFILPGGGVRGSFQAGFLWCLKSHYSNLFSIYQIDGTSVGALNGYAFLIDEPEYIRNLWFSINSIEDVFNSYSQKPVWSKIKTFYNGFFEKSISQNDGLRKIVNENRLNINNELRPLYNCVVTNVYTGTYEYINGTRDNIHEYVVASASPWVISPPVEVDNYLYVDGGLLQTYPMENVKKSKADIKLLLGYDSTHLNKIGMAGTNLIHYLIRLIDIARLNHNNIYKLNKYIKKYNVVSIENPLDYPFLDFSHDKVLEGFNLGIKSAHEFAIEYLNP
jgi:predicted patatin/cPLA2 family phospholipase